MSKLSQRFERLVEAYADAVIRWRWLVLLASLLAVVAAASGARLLTLKNDYKMWFAPDDPELVAYEALQNTYTRNDNILFVLAPRDGQVFTPDTLAAVETLTREAWKLPYAIRVDSVSNFQHTEAEGDDLIVQDLVKDARGLSAEALAHKQAIALAEPALLNRLINPDASVTGVNVTIALPMQSPEESPRAVGAARALAERIEADHPGLDLRLTGAVVLNEAFAEAAVEDMGSLVPLMYLVILAVMVLMLRSAVATVATTLVILFSIATAMGLAGWLGFPITPPLASAPTMIMTLAVADSVHVLVTLFEGMRAGASRQEALKRSLRLNAYPMLLTTVTTAIGFLTMDASEAPPFKDVGYVVAIGVTAALFYSLVLLPALIAILPLRAPRAGKSYTLGLDRLGDWVVRHARPVLWTMVGASVLILAMIPRNQLNDEFVKYFGESTSFRQDTDFTQANLTGVNQIQFSIPAPGSNGVSDPAFLGQLDAFTGWLRAQPEVVHVSSISDVFKRLNQNLHGDAPEAYRLPEDRALAAQYLLLYELSLPYGLDLNNQLNVDKSATHLIVTASSLSSAEIRALAARAEGWLEANAPTLLARGSGTPLMYANISERNIKSMLKGTLIGLALISLLLILALGSVRVGLLSLIPNLLPVGLAFGLWGLFVGQVNLAVSVVAGVTFGIVVDDTIHFLSKYLRGRRHYGMSSADSLRLAFSEAGTALVVTTLILVAGFLVLSLSSFGVNASMAQLTAVALLLAVFGDFMLLPALLMLVDRDPAPATVKETVHGTPQAVTD